MNDLLLFGFDYFLEEPTALREIHLFICLLKAMVKDTNGHQIIRTLLAKNAGRDAELQCPPGRHSPSIPTCSQIQRFLNSTLDFYGHKSGRLLIPFSDLVPSLENGVLG